MKDRIKNTEVYSEKSIIKKMIKDGKSEKERSGRRKNTPNNSEVSD